MKKILLALCCSLLLFPLAAQNIIRPKIAGPNGLWVNSYNGVLFFGRTDFETQNSAMPMGLRFYYNSSSNNKNYGYGNGFSLGYEMRYEVEDNGDVKIIQGDGRSDVFKKFGDEFEAPAGVFSTLTAEGSGYLVTEKTGERFYFFDAAHKRLTAQEDSYGNRTDLTYQNNLLIQIKDAVGHTIKLEYTDTLLTKATATFLNGSFSYQYDAKGRLRKITDAMGYTTLYDYDKENRLDEITDANGNKTNISYNNAGMASRLKTAVSDKSIRYDGDKTVFIDYTEPQNQYSYYRWDDKGRVIEKVGLCCGTQATLEYDEDDNVIKRTDANGGISTYTYDDRGNMLSATDPMGYTERYTYEPTFNQVLTYQDKNGNSYSFSYDTKGNITSIFGPEGFSNRFTYNDKGWLITSADANGNVTRTNYNPDGTTASILDAAGYIHPFGYDSYGNIITLTDGNGNTTNYCYDANYRITSQTDALGNTTIISYDKVGNIVRVKDVANHVVGYTYDALGNVLTKTDATGNVTKLTYDGKGNIISKTDALGRRTTMTYNDHNKMLSHLNPAGEITSFDYDKAGNLIAMFLPNCNDVFYDYDLNNNLLEVQDKMGIIASYTYDGNGNQLTVTDGLGRMVRYTYDGLNRRKSEILPSGATKSFNYDNNSNLLSITDALGHVTTYTYSPLNKQLSNINALNAKTTFEYDGNGNLIKVTDAKNNPTVWTYDALNRNTQITFANGSSLQYTYDALGNVQEYRDRAGNITKYSYDVLGRLLSKVYADKSEDTFSYDAVGQMLTANNENAKVSFSYDMAGRLLSETLNDMTTQYTYDVANGVHGYVYPSGMKVDEYLNGRNLISSILQNGSEVVTVNYNTAGQKISQTYANGITTNYEYNENGWLSHIVDNAKILDLVMTYDGVGNIIQSKDRINEDRTEEYCYDAISQLLSFRRGDDVNKSYQLDLLGNRIETNENGISTLYKSNNVNDYTSLSGGLNVIPKYDDNGNLIYDGNHTYVYDYNNHVILVDNNMVSFKYDALGRRISKNNINFAYSRNLILEEWGDNKVTKTNVYGDWINEIIKSDIEGQSYFCHLNQIGSLMATTDQNAIIEERLCYDIDGSPYAYDNYGNSISTSNIKMNTLFSGLQYDSETGIYDAKVRSLHPEFYRFMQNDPLLYVDGYNTKKYALNNSVTNIDPLGLFSSKDFMNMFGKDVCNSPQNNSCSSNDTPLLDALSDFTSESSDAFGYADGISSMLANFGMKVYWGKDAKNIFNPIIKGGKDTFKFFDTKFSFAKNPHPGRGYVRYNNFGKLFGYLGKAFQGGNMIIKAQKGQLTTCDWVDFGIGWDPFTGALTFGWDIGNLIRKIPLPNNNNLGNWMDDALSPIFDPIVSAVVEFQMVGSISDAGTLKNYLSY